MGNNQHLLHRALVSFMADARALPQRLQAGLHSDDKALVQRELHGFKGLSATVGVLELSELAARAEKLFRASGASEEYGAAVAQLEARLAQLIPVLDGVAARLAPLERVAPTESAPVTLDHEILQQMKELLLALQASDMGAMELHARMRQSIDESLAQSLAGLDEAMADLEFELAATECEKLVCQFETI
jgi:HPt (histidine-containing phosphotransfer) domain-containing protein